MTTTRTRSIAKQLLPAAPGFTASSGILRSVESGVVRLVMVERGKYTTSEDNPVTLMLGVLSVRSIDLLGSSIKNEVRNGAMSWPWRQRIGQVMPERKDVWWELGPEGSEAEATGLTHLRHALADHGLPALAEVGTETGLFERLRARFRLHGSGLPYEEVRWFTALAHLLGESEQATAGVEVMRGFGLDEAEVREDLQRLGG